MPEVADGHAGRPDTLKFVVKTAVGFSPLATVYVL